MLSIMYYNNYVLQQLCITTIMYYNNSAETEKKTSVLGQYDLVSR